MRHTVVVLSLLLLAGAAGAQEPDRDGFTFAARLGYAHPFGDAAGNVDTGADVPLDESFERAIPVIVEAGYRFSGVALGLYYQHGFASVDDSASFGAGTCAEVGATCDSGRVKRFGIQANYAFPAVRPLAPWIGAAAGWEWASLELSAAGETADVTFKGFDLTLQGGGDVQISPQLWVGPYASASFGRYSDLEIEGPGFSIEAEIDEKRWHTWLQVGVRVRFDL